jgi:hypothetical protein
MALSYAYPGAALGQSGAANGWQRHAIGVRVQNAAPGPLYAGSGTFLALVTSGALSSKDGVTWHSVSGSLLAYAQSLHIPDLNLARVGMDGVISDETASVKADGPKGALVAVGSSHKMGQLMTTTRARVALSSDGGKTWQTVSDSGPVFTDAAMTDVASDGSHWVAVGYKVGATDRPLVWTSTDCRHWQRVAQPPKPSVTDELNVVLHGRAGFLAVASGLDGPAGVWSSPDGTHWTGVNMSVFHDAIVQQVSVGGPGYLAVGQQDGDPLLWSSVDGRTWRRVTAFPGGDTAVQGVAASGHRLLVVGWYGRVARGQFGTQFAARQPSSWVWNSPSGSSEPAPLGSGSVDAKSVRLRIADLPAGFSSMVTSGWMDFCDDGNTLCRSVHNAVGPFEDYGVQFERGGRGAAVVQSMTILGTHSDPAALAALGPHLVAWWDRDSPITTVHSEVHIGTETRIYRISPPATSNPPGGRLTAYTVAWRLGAGIGLVYVEEPRTVSPRAVEAFAVRLARKQMHRLHP